MRALLLARKSNKVQISADRRGEGLSLETQDEVARLFAEAQGWTVIGAAGDTARHLRPRDQGRLTPEDRRLADRRGRRDRDRERRVERGHGQADPQQCHLLGHAHAHVRRVRRLARHHGSRARGHGDPAASRRRAQVPRARLEQWGPSLSLPFNARALLRRVRRSPCTDTCRTLRGIGTSTTTAREGRPGASGRAAGSWSVATSPTPQPTRSWQPTTRTRRPLLSPTRRRAGVGDRARSPRRALGIRGRRPR
jgi:hypothetical protein